MRIAIRPDGSDNLKILQFSDQDEAKAAMVRYLNEAASNGTSPPHFYRIIKDEPNVGDFTLRRLRKQNGTQVDRTVIDTVEFEDDV